MKHCGFWSKNLVSYYWNAAGFDIQFNCFTLKMLRFLPYTFYFLCLTIKIMTIFSTRYTPRSYPFITFFSIRYSTSLYILIKMFSIRNTPTPNMKCCCFGHTLYLCYQLQHCRLFTFTFILRLKRCGFWHTA